MWMVIANCMSKTWRIKKLGKLLQPSTDTAAKFPLKGVIEKSKTVSRWNENRHYDGLPTSPTNIYVVDLDKNEDEYNCTRVTTSLIGNLSENILIKPQLIKYKSFDALEISAFLHSLFTNTDTNFKR